MDAVCSHPHIYGARGVYVCEFATSSIECYVYKKLAIIDLGRSCRDSRTTGRLGEKEDGRTAWSVLLQLPDLLDHLLLHRLVRIHDRLLVDNDFRRVGLWSAHPRCDGRSVRVDDDPIIWKFSHMFIERSEHRPRTRCRSSRLDITTPSRDSPVRLASRPDSSKVFGGRR